MKKWFYLFLPLLLALFFLPVKREEFKAGYVQGKFDFIPVETLGAPLAIKQPLTYLGKGGQAYAFETADGKLVLKFLKFKTFRPRLSNKLISLIPFMGDYEANFIAKKQKKFAELYEGYKLAYMLNQEGSGLLYLHFEPTQNQFGTVELIDRQGKKHLVDLDTTVFVIQEKGRLLNELLDEALDQGDHQKAENLLLSFMKFYLSQYAKGLYDRDYGLVHNVGFVGEKPIHIDMGKITYDERMKDPKVQKEDLKLVFKRFEKWLLKHHPKQASQLMEKLSSYLGT